MKSAAGNRVKLCLRHECGIRREVQALAGLPDTVGNIEGLEREERAGWATAWERSIE